MSQADVDVIRKGFAAFAEQGIGAVLQFAHPDIEVLSDAPGAQRFEGHAGIVQSFEDQLEAFEDWSVEPEEFVDVGDHVVVVVRQRARGRGSGVVLDTHSAWAFTMRDGKASRLAIYVDKEQAIEALQPPQTRRQ